MGRSVSVHRLIECKCVASTARAAAAIHCIFIGAMFKIEDLRSLPCCQVPSVSIRRIHLHVCRSFFRRNSACPAQTHRSAFEQAVDWRSAGASAAPEQPAHVDGGFARRPLRGHGECRLRNLRVAIRCSRSRCSTRRPARSPIFPTRAPRCARSRRSTPASPSAAMAVTFMPAWLRCPIPKGEDPGDTGSGIVVYSFADGRIAPERLIHCLSCSLPPGRKTRLPGGKDERPRRAVPGCDCGAGRGRPREAAGGGKSFRRCGAARRCDRRHREAIRSVGERCACLRRIPLRSP